MRRATAQAEPQPGYDAFRKALAVHAAGDRYGPLARSIAAHRFEVAFGAVKDVAESGGVSTAAVVRFSQPLGFCGFCGDARICARPVRGRRGLEESENVDAGFR